MNEFTQSFLEILIPILASLLAALSAMAIKKLQKKFDLDLSQKQNDMVRGLVRDGIASAEEWAYRKAKLPNNGPISGSMKASRVIGMVKAVYPKVEENEIAMMMDAEIARSAGLGSSEKRIDV